MNKSAVLRYKNLLLAKREELSAGTRLVDSIPVARELCADSIDMATIETDSATQIRLHETDGENALTWSNPVSAASWVS